MTREPRQVLFHWHMHQPYYGLPSRPTNYLPWVRLHCIRSYYDMARLLEEHPEVRATVNFSGALLRQIREYVEEGRRDTWWDLSLKPAKGLDEHDQRHLLRHFFSLDHENGIKPYPRYRKLLEMRGEGLVATSPSAFSTADYRDLQVWFNLAWFGFSARDERPIVQELLAKGAGFSEAEKEALLEQQIDIMQLVLPLYRRLHRRGQVELSVTPMYHPILPLLIDTDSAKRATPERASPPRLRAHDDAEQHVWGARNFGRECLGVDVDGMWPAEGAISPEALRVFADQEVRWIASDEHVLRRSRGDAFHRDADLYRPWRLGVDSPTIFFRDHDLSDRISFTYATMPADDAIDDCMSAIRAAGDFVTIIMDGENPWEAYPDSGEAFLNGLYEALAAAEDVVTTTPVDLLDDGVDVGTLDELHSGSWIDANFAIWIGHDETNAAWDLLRQTREALIEHAERNEFDPEIEEAAWDALFIAEGSDWFWWYGDDFSTLNDPDFDRLFREQLLFVYRSLRLPVPREFQEPIGAAVPATAQFERPTGLITPKIDGVTEEFYEWEGAGVYLNGGTGGQVIESVRFVERVFVGFDLVSLYLRIDYGRDMATARHAFEVDVWVAHSQGRFRIRLSDEGGGAGYVEWETDGSRVVLDDVVFGRSIEAAIPFDDLELQASDDFWIWLSFSDDKMELERHPPVGGIELTVPDQSFEMTNWIV